MDGTQGTTDAGAARTPPLDDRSTFTLYVNGTARDLTLDHRTTVLGADREVRPHPLSIRTRRRRRLHG